MSYGIQEWIQMLTVWWLKEFSANMIVVAEYSDCRDSEYSVHMSCARIKITCMLLVWCNNNSNNDNHQRKTATAHTHHVLAVERSAAGRSTLRRLGDSAVMYARSEDGGTLVPHVSYMNFDGFIFLVER
jgi:hypothetical protein